MKSKFYYTVALVLLTNFCVAQLEIKPVEKSIVVGTVKSGLNLVAELSYKPLETDTLFVLLFNNMQYKTINDYQAISFVNQEGAVDGLYKILKSVFLDENKKNKDYRVEFKLGDYDVTASNFRMMGATSVMIWTKKGYFYLSEKQVDKLFSHTTH